MASSKNRKILILGVAILGTLGFVGPLLITLYSVFTGVEQAPPPQPVESAQPQDDPAQIRAQIAGYEQVLKREPNNPSVLQNLSTLYLRSGDINKAASTTARLVEQQPDNPQLRAQLAALYQISGQFGKAEQTYDQVLAKDKNNVNALVGKADLEKAKGNKAAAKALYTRAEQAAPVDVKPRVREYAAKALAPTPAAPAKPPGPASTP